MEVEDLRCKNRILHNKLEGISKKLNSNKSESQRPKIARLCAKDEVKIDAVSDGREIKMLPNEHDQDQRIEEEITKELGCYVKKLDSRKIAFRGQQSMAILDEKCESINHCCPFEDTESQYQTADCIEVKFKELRKNVNDLEVKNSELHTLNEKFYKENRKLIKQNKKLKNHLQNIGTSGVKRFDSNASVETPVGKSNTLNDDTKCNLDEKLSKIHFDYLNKIPSMLYRDLNESRENVCNKLKSKLEVCEKEASKWVELGQFIQAKLDEQKTVQHGTELNVEHIKQKLMPLFDEHRRLKCTENLVKQQLSENQGIRQSLSLAISRNIASNNQLSKLALRERQFHEVKRKLSKVCNENRLLKRDLRQSTKRFAQYEDYHNNHESIARGHEQFLFQYETVYEDSINLQNENEVLHTKGEASQTLQGRIDQQNCDNSSNRNDHINQQFIFRNNEHKVND